MPYVTDIKRQRRVGSNRFNVSVDGSYAFTISDLELSSAGLRVGQEIDQKELAEFKRAAGEAKAYALALRFLGVRLRSRRELLDYLQRKGCEDEDIQEALRKLEGLGLVDDSRFAKAWIADRNLIRPRSKRRLTQELLLKGVDRGVVEQVVNEIEPERELDSLKEIIQRKRRLSAYAHKDKLLAYLQRQGYKWSMIQQAFDELGED